MIEGDFMRNRFIMPIIILLVVCGIIAGCRYNAPLQNEKTEEKPIKPETSRDNEKESETAISNGSRSDEDKKETLIAKRTENNENEEAELTFNNWKYKYQHDFYVHQITNGETDISATTKIFINDYFQKNSNELRSLPAFNRGRSPEWNALTKFIYEKANKAPNEMSITEEQFDEVAKKYFGDITYIHKSSTYLTYKDGKYTPNGWSNEGSFIYELIKLEKGKTKERKEIWKAHITGYLFYELDGDPNTPRSEQSKNAQAVWEEMKKKEYYGLDFWGACDRLVFNNPGSILDPACEWIIEFTVNDPMGDLHFTYLSCEKKE